MQATTTRPKIIVSADGTGIVSHAGSRLLADLADATTLTSELSEVLVGLRRPRTRHDPGRVLTDLAVAIADGAEAINDIAVLVDQPGLFGAVASDSTCWRLLEALDGSRLAAVAAARARAREIAWAQRAEVTGRAFARSRVAGSAGIDALVIDLDAHVLVCHSEKQQAAPTFKHSFGYHPLLAYLDNTGEFLAARLRPGNAGSNTAADHITVLDAALAQIPDRYRHGHPILVRADGAGCTKAFLAHIRSLRDTGVNSEFSVGWTITTREHTAIAALRDTDWTATTDPNGEPRPLREATVAEITGLLPAAALATYPAGMRVIVRRERPHPGAQLDLIEQRDGWRYTAHATDTRAGQHVWLDARHRAHARVEDRIRTGRDTGLGRLPSRSFAINAAWLTAAMIAVDLIAFAQTVLLHDTTHARAEPKTLRYRLLHTAARITRGQRRRWLRLDQHWPWTAQLAAAFARLAALPTPAG
ncbi:IS1380 family transposase [Pseudonocardia lacus]|uniref:IS1380 family transposase n=1 Tax=Pseudonocardia lacus TaxID=2835865 RepID=UPI003D9C1E72